MPGHAISPCLTLWLAWPSSVVVLLNFSLGCGNSLTAIRLLPQVCSSIRNWLFSSINEAHCTHRSRLDTAFSSFGAFWMSFGTIMIPGSGIVSSYPSVTEFQNASGIYLTIWSMVTFFLLSASCPFFALTSD